MVEDVRGGLVEEATLHHEPHIIPPRNGRKHRPFLLQVQDVGSRCKLTIDFGKQRPLLLQGFLDHRQV